MLPFGGAGSSCGTTDALTPRFLALLEADDLASPRGNAAASAADLEAETRARHLEELRSMWQQALYRQSVLESEKERLVCEVERLRLAASPAHIDPYAERASEASSPSSPAETFTSVASSTSDVRRAGAIGAELRGALEADLARSRSSGEAATLERLAGLRREGESVEGAAAVDVAKPPIIGWDGQSAMVQDVLGAIPAERQGAASGGVGGVDWAHSCGLHLAQVYAALSWIDKHLRACVCAGFPLLDRLTSTPLLCRDTAAERAHDLLEKRDTMMLLRDGQHGALAALPAVARALGSDLAAEEVRVDLALAEMRQLEEQKEQLRSSAELQSSAAVELATALDECRGESCQRMDAHRRDVSILLAEVRAMALPERADATVAAAEQKLSAPLDELARRATAATSAAAAAGARPTRPPRASSPMAWLQDRVRDARDLMGGAQPGSGGLRARRSSSPRHGSRDVGPRRDRRFCSPAHAAVQPASHCQPR